MIQDRFNNNLIVNACAEVGTVYECGIVTMDEECENVQWFPYSNNSYGVIWRALRQLPDSSYTAGYAIGDPFDPNTTSSFIKRISHNGTIIDSIQIDYELYGSVSGMDTCQNGYMMMESVWEEFIITSDKYAIARRTDMLGVPIWEHYFAPTYKEAALGWTATMPNDNVAVTRSSPDTVINGDEDAYPYRKFVACLDGDTGNQLWRVFFDEEWGKEIAGIKIARNGDIIGVGTDLGEGSCWLFRISPQGQLLWEHTYDNLTYPNAAVWGGCHLYDLCETPDGGIAATGYMVKKNANNQWESDVWLLKVDANGCLTPGCTEMIIDVGVSVAEPVAPSLQGSYAVYPNPASNYIQLHADFLPPYQPVDFALYDINGRLQYQKTLPNASAPRHTDISHLLAGMYIYEFSQNRQVLGSGKLLKLPSR
ncbi:MAG: T9SS type A sorting domain-containing protein [Sphingobacteriales bacterium]|nr:T9SS type A sorting domain-containing protein [Sphingobacteriales bacterium]